MDCHEMHSYEETIATLNSLQSNAQTLEKNRRDPTLPTKHVRHMQTFLDELGITPEDIDGLNSIHVAGTKGKGSTCAFAESILRRHGLRTGFYSSPHLVEARERIRIGGRPLSRQAFTTYFWEVYRKLHRQTDLMPPYFMFLTLMAFYTFLQEKVDVAVVEVGLGGEYDCTNVIRKPEVVGITSIGLDHTSILGDTLPKIAWQKSGILKNSVAAFTVPQPDGVMPVFKKRTQLIGCTLQIVPPLENYEWQQLSLGVPGSIQRINASLAVQLANAWLQNREAKSGGKRACGFVATEFFVSPALAEPFRLSSEFVAGLEGCFWPGRFHTICREGVTYFLDGAHTEESMVCCTKWYMENSKKHLGAKPFRVLIFNCTGDRRAEMLLSPLAEIPFDVALFSTNRVHSTKDSTSDQSNFMLDPQKELDQCQMNARIWSYLQSIVAEEDSTVPTTPGHVFPCLSQAMRWLKDSSSVPRRPLQVLVTGSLHLVGGILAIVDPDLTDQQNRHF